ncbi:MAG: hypothetical protein ACI9EZ_000698, partial [Halobacteriales archaeon]
LDSGIVRIRPSSGGTGESETDPGVPAGRLDDRTGTLK